MKSHHQDSLIEIQFTRPCSFECLSGRPGLVALQSCKQMPPALPEQCCFLHCVLGSPHSKVTLKKGGWWERPEGGKPTCNSSTSSQFSLPLLWAQRSTLVDMLWSDVWQTQNNAPILMPHKERQLFVSSKNDQVALFSFLLKWPSCKYDCYIKIIWSLQYQRHLLFPIWKTWHSQCVTGVGHK